MAAHGSDVSKNLGKNQEISTKAPIYRVAGIEIDPVQASVRRGGEPIALRPKTYRFLLYLVEHHNRLVTKEELIHQVWDGANVSDGVLVRSVVELRKAFGDDPRDAGIIKTFPKMGYGLMAPVENISFSEETLPEPFPGVSPRPAKSRIAHPAIIAASAMVLIAAGTAELRWKHVPAPGRLYREAAWWKLDDVRGRRVADASGNGIAGTLPTDGHIVAGKLGGALSFDGLHTEIVGRADKLPSGNSPRTITAWFKAAFPHVDQASLFEYGPAKAAAPLEKLALFLQSDGHLNFASAGSVIGARDWADGQWHFVAAEYGGARARSGRIYVDGQLDGEKSFAVDAATSKNGAWKIGGFLISGASFRGAMDDVRVYPRALGAAVLTGIYRCSAGIRDVDQYFYLPVFSANLAFENRGPHDLSTPFRHTGTDLGGIQLARAEDDCGLAYLEGADAGQDLQIAVDLMVPLSGDGRPTIAGPYFRSRLAAGGDGLVGGTSAGYWVQLVTGGMVKIKRLNPWALVAFSDPDPGFDPTVFHHLELQARGQSVEVWLDGKALSFDQGGNHVKQVQIPPAWLGPPVVGANQGAAGVAFATLDQDRGLAGGQRVRNLQVHRLDSR